MAEYRMKKREQAQLLAQQQQLQHSTQQQEVDAQLQSQEARERSPVLPVPCIIAGSLVQHHQEQPQQERPSTPTALTARLRKRECQRKYMNKCRKKKREQALQEQLQEQSQQERPSTSTALTAIQRNREYQRKYMNEYRKKKREQAQRHPQQQHPIQQQQYPIQQQLQHSSQQQELQVHQAQQQQHAGTSEFPMLPSTSNALTAEETRRQIHTTHQEEQLLAQQQNIEQQPQQEAQEQQHTETASYTNFMEHSAAHRQFQLKFQRLDKIELLGKVMYEYVLRAVYHNVAISGDIVLRKAEEVKECIAIKNFRPRYLWLIEFKKTYDIDDFSLETLRSKISITEVKRRQMDAVDMVGYVRQQECTDRNSNLKKNDTYRINILNSPTRMAESRVEYVIENQSATEMQKKGNVCNAQVDNTSNPQTAVGKASDSTKIQLHKQFSSAHFSKEGSDIDKRKLTPLQLRDKNEPKIVYEMCDEEMYKPSLIDNECLITNSDEELGTIKIENSTMQLSEGITPDFINQEANNETLPHAIADQNKPLPTWTENILQEQDLYGVTVDRALIKIETSPTHSSENKQPVTIFKKYSDEDLATKKQQADRDIEPLQSFSAVNEPSIKTEISSSSLSDDEEFITIYKIVDHESIMSPKTIKSPQLDVGNHVLTNDAEIIKIKQEPLMNDTDIEPNNAQLVGSNELQIHKNPYPQSLKSANNWDGVLVKDELTEDTESQICFDGASGRVVLEPCNNNDQPMTLLHNKDYHCPNFPPPPIVSPEEAMMYVKLLEDYAMLKDNNRAKNLLTMLGETFTEPDKS